MLLVDPRVGSKHMAPLFEKLGAPFEVTPLEFGDIAFLGNGPDGPVRVGIEIKGGRGGSDFLQSMQSDRLVGVQVPGISNYDRRYLIVEGLRPTRKGVLWTPPRKGGGQPRPIFMADIRKYLTGIEESGLRVRHTRTPADTARLIVRELYAFWQKEYKDHTSVPANVLYQAPLFSLRQEDEALARVRRVVVALKAGVGVGRSKAVAQRFGSVYALVTADEGAWEGIEGVGKKIAGDVIGAVREVIPNFQDVPTTRVPPRRDAASRGPRRARGREDKQLDAGRHSQRRVSEARTRRGVAR